MNDDNNNQYEKEHSHAYLQRKRRFVATSKQKAKTVEFKLVQAIYQNDDDKFNQYIRRLKTIDTPIGTGRSKWTALMFSVHKRRWKFVTVLLQKGANPNCIDAATRKTCLHMACTGGYQRIVRCLLQTTKILDINDNNNADGESPIFCAVKKGRIRCVELLLDYKLHGQVCNINLKTNGHSPLLIACDKGDADMVRWLINYKHCECDLNSRDNKGYTPLMKAVGKGHREVIQLLLEKSTKLDLNLMNNLNQCAAVIAVRSNKFAVSKMILDAQKSVDVLYRMDYRNRTLLDQCVQFRAGKDIVCYVMKMLHFSVCTAFQSINNSDKHSDVPYLPIGIVQSICNMTY